MRPASARIACRHTLFEEDDPPVGAHVDIHGSEDDEDEDECEQYVDPNADHPIDADRVTAALNAAQEYFRSELDDIHRRGGKSRWGLTEETIDEAGIGFCPDRDDLSEHLRDAGFEAVEMLATGLFSESGVKHAMNGCDDPAECGHDIPEDLEMLGAAIRDGDADPNDVDIGASSTASRSQRVSHFTSGGMTDLLSRTTMRTATCSSSRRERREARKTSSTPTLTMLRST